MLAIDQTMNIVTYIHVFGLLYTSRVIQPDLDRISIIIEMKTPSDDI